MTFSFLRYWIGLTCWHRIHFILRKHHLIHKNMFQNSVGACAKEGNWSWFYCWIEVGYYQENILVQCKSGLKESILGHVKFGLYSRRHVQDRLKSGLCHKKHVGDRLKSGLSKGKTMHVRTGYMLDSNRGSVLRTG